MSLQTLLSPFHSRAGISYNLGLAIGAMLATLAVVAYADLASSLPTDRVHIILQGAQMILLTVSAGVIAGALHVLGTAGEHATPVLLPRHAARA